MKQIVLANDVAGIGKVATCAALPVYAVCHVTANVLPTVLLSSHTGGFEKVYVDTYTEGMAQFIEQWSTLPIQFDALVTGYCRTGQQLTLLEHFLTDDPLRGAALMVDPVMGDNGNLYQGFDGSYVAHMRHFCQRADMILPNLTEAYLLTDTPYQVLPSRTEVFRLVEQLASLGAREVVLTGVSFATGEIGACCYQADSDQFDYISAIKQPVHFFGTGDLLTAAVTAARLRGCTLPQAVDLAVRFISRSLAETVARGLDVRYGVCFEPQLLSLAQELNFLVEELET